MTLMRNFVAAVLACLVGLALLCAPRAARAFCGFYVSGADTRLYNNATMVVLMRDGQRTVLSMQNNYQGPPEKFAMVVPVPVVLQKENVKTLDRTIFDRVDQLAAPRLVEYWEQDPCAPDPQLELRKGGGPVRRAPAPPAAAGAGSLGVTIEAQFTVGEYEVVVLSAKDSGGLDTWLKQEGYKIPEGSEPYLRPYVQSGMKFFVAKVDIQKVKFEAGMATLSPLRFHYDTEKFNLPIRLGLVNAKGAQDLIVHILAKGQRYEVANYPNVTIPTNFDLSENARGRFSTFYASLFDRTVEKTPKAVVTEYAWDASTCDPCPTPALSFNELATLGADVLPSAPPPPTGPATGPAPRRTPWFSPSGFVLTRLHARYTKEALGEDLVFKQATAITGGREVRVKDDELEHGAASASMNNFQGRYAMRHPWTGPIACDAPKRGRWGGPTTDGPGDSRPKAATNLAFAPRGGAPLTAFLVSAVPELGVKPVPFVALPAPAASVADAGGGAAASTPSDAAALSAAPAPPSAAPAPSAPGTPPAKSGGCTASGAPLAPLATSPWGALALVVPVLAYRARRKRTRCTPLVHRRH